MHFLLYIFTVRFIYRSYFFFHLQKLQSCKNAPHNIFLCTSVAKGLHSLEIRPRESEWSGFYSVESLSKHDTTHNFEAVKFGTAGLGTLEAKFYLFGFTGFLPSRGLQEKVHMSSGSNNQTEDKYLHV